MKILVTISMFVAALLAIAAVMWEALLLTVFSATHEFMYAGQALAAAIFMLTIGGAFRKKVRKWLTFGSALFFSLCASAVLFFHIGLQEGYVPRIEISLPRWHFTAFTCAGIGFSVIPLLLLIVKWPNQSLEPTATAVTDRAAHAPRHP